ncbi:MAG: ATP-dependent zinc metalloprotease FtsH [Vampirovibrionales bacterium]
MFVTVFLLIALLLATSYLVPRSPKIVTAIPYSQFIDKVAHHRISEVVIKSQELIALPTPDEKPAVTSSAVKQPTPLEASQSVKSQAAPAPHGSKTQVEKPSSSSPPAVSQSTPPQNVPVFQALSLKPIQPTQHYKVTLPPSGVPSTLLSQLEKYHVKYTFEAPAQPNQWTAMLWSLLVPGVILFFFILLLRNLQSGGGQALSFGKSRAKMVMENKIKVRFQDVAGVDEPKQELEEIVDFLKNSEKYQKLGAKIPKGVLLVGPPGTGKTLLAKAVAGEAGVPFFSISGSDFVEMFVGVGASRVRDLFEQAKKNAPCIIFIDEIDAVGRQRGAGMGGGHDEREQTLNQLLVEMDGFEATLGIIMIAATNRPDILDKALLRPGRFDRQVILDHPDVKGREEILRVHAKGKALDDHVDLNRLAKATPGFTGADLQNLLNEGALLAARKDKTKIEQSDIEASIDRVVAGVERKSKLMNRKDKEITAYHEVGHTLVAWFTEEADPVRKVTIVPRGMALGITWTMPDDTTNASRKHLLAEIAVLLGGRIAEELVYGDVTVGASNDLQRVSKIARSIVTAYGMSDVLGPITYGDRQEHVFMGRDFGSERNYSEQVATQIDEEVKTLVFERVTYVRALLAEKRDAMDAIVKELLEQETLDDADLERIIGEPQVKDAEKLEAIAEARTTSGSGGSTPDHRGDEGSGSSSDEDTDVSVKEPSDECASHPETPTSTTDEAPPASSSSVQSRSVEPLHTVAGYFRLSDLLL